jgi:hypothetical protein
MSFWSACLHDSAMLLRAAAHHTGAEALAMTPSAEDAREVRALTGLPSLAQAEPGLGAALLEVSDLPAPFAVAVNADTPTLPPETLVRAVAAVRAGRPVLGPGPDGGYYLVGLPRGFDRGRRVQAFLGSALGSGGAFAQAREALGRAELLEPWSDVDTAADVRALSAELRGEPSRAPAVAAWFDRYRPQRVG